MNNLIWIDVETTGLYANTHDIVQLACVPVIDGETKDSFNQFCQPTNYNVIQQEAIDTHGITIDRMRTFQSPEKMLDNFIKYLEEFGVQFTIAGYNVSFDRQFLCQFFTKHGRSKDFFKLFSLGIHDTFSRAKKIKRELGLASIKLSNLAEHFAIPIIAHDALSDISATIVIDQHISEILGEAASAVIGTKKKYDIDFIEPAQLHLHSSYGVNSVASVQDWEQWCIDNNVCGFSTVDHNIAVSLQDIITISKKNNGVTGVPGICLYIQDPDIGRYQLNMWGVSNDGYFNLMRLASVAYYNRKEEDGQIIPAIDSKYITTNNIKDILVSFSDAYGTIGQHIAAGNTTIAEKIVKHIINKFGKDSVYAEFNPIDITHRFTEKIGFQPINRNKAVPDGNLGASFNHFMAKIVDKYNIKAIPVSGAHFIDVEDKIVQDCISKNAFDSNKYFNESYNVVKAKEMYSGLKHCLGDWLTVDKFNEWIQNTHDIVEMAKTINISHEYHLPEIDIPQHIQDKIKDYKQQCFIYMMEKIKEHGRWVDTTEYKERFKKEIDVIMNNKEISFIPYFLVYEDMCSYARSVGILPGEGRGSAGGCLLSYYLKIIHIDPIQADLPFERFLSHARINAKSFPDIDGDFSDRTPIIKYLADKYKLGFAQIATFQRLKTKKAIKDSMWALYGRNNNDPEIKSVCDTIPDSPQGTDEKDFLYGFVDKEGDYHPGEIETNEHCKLFMEQYPEVEKMVKKLIGTTRGYGRHASAYVVSTLNLSHSRIPTMIMDDPKLGSITVTQASAKQVESVGLIKADILKVTGLKTVMQCIEMVKERVGIDYMKEDNEAISLIYRLPDDDDVYNDFYNKKTDSSFQFNTPLIKGFVQQFRPRSKEDLAAFTALCRPGALDAPFVNDEISIDDGVSAAQYYMDVQSGARKLSYLHPDLVTCTTNGIFVFQEEVMKFLTNICGYTLEKADQIRAAIAKKKQEIIMATFDDIRRETFKRGWTIEQTEAVCGQILAFAKYSFNRSHARCYADQGYITMYLKNKHPLEWWCAVLNTTDGNESKVRHYVSLLGDMVKSPSISTPSKTFNIRGDGIVAPISVIKGIGDNTVEELIKKGPFLSLKDFVKRIEHRKVNIGHISSLIKARAADDLMDNSIDYIQARYDFMEEYCQLRKCKNFKEDMWNITSVDVFIQEKEYNQCFNKTLLSDPDVSKMIVNRWPDLSKTDKIAIPYFIRNTPIISNLKIAEGMVAKRIDREVGMMLLYQGSRLKQGVSKKSGKEYCFVSVTLSDGYSEVECTWWDRKKPLGWKKDTIVYVTGTLKEGWKSPVAINVIDMDRIDKEKQ